MPRGGMRAGSPGRSYENRTDMNTVRALPVTVGPSQQYGQATALANAQRAVPTANGPLPSAPPMATMPGAASMPTPPPSSPTPGPPMGVPTPPPSQPAPPGPRFYPGELPDFAGPSAYPGEHVMTGIDQGGGAGSSALPPHAQPSNQTVGNFLQTLANMPGMPADITNLARMTGPGRPR